MNYSTYQMQRLIGRLRRMGRWLAWPAWPVDLGPDAVRASAAARAAAGDTATAGRAAAPPAVGAVRAQAQHDPRVELERERRAGSFMQPPYAPDPPAPPIPKRPRQPRRESPRSLGDG